MKAKATIGVAASCLLALCCSLGKAAADENKPVVIGATTEAILKMQRDGTAAGQSQPVTGDVATRSYKRYLDSFSRPMPESGPANNSAAKPVATGSR